MPPPPKIRLMPSRASSQQWPETPRMEESLGRIIAPCSWITTPATVGSPPMLHSYLQPGSHSMRSETSSLLIWATASCAGAQKVFPHASVRLILVHTYHTCTCMQEALALSASHYSTHFAMALCAGWTQRRASSTLWRATTLCSIPSC